MTSKPGFLLRSILCVLLGTLSSTVVVASPAAAETPGCVSRAEYSVVQNKVAGYSRSERMVQRLFDVRGALEVNNPGRKLMFYPACWARNRSIWVGYKWGYGRLAPGKFGRGWFYEFKSMSL